MLDAGGRPFLNAPDAIKGGLACLRGQHIRRLSTIATATGASAGRMRSTATAIATTRMDVSAAATISAIPTTAAAIEPHVVHEPWIATVDDPARSTSGDDATRPGEL